MNSHTTPINAGQAEKLRLLLRERGFEFHDTPHALYSARKKGISVTVYAKGPKVLVQGGGTEDFLRFILEPEILGEAKLGYEEQLHPERYEPHFGIDESGKGDYFGPLVIAGVYTDAEVARRFTQAGVMDSKRIAGADRIRKLAEAIRSTPGCVWHVVSIGPERYNELHASFGNLNRLLAWGHARVIEGLAAKQPGCPRALSDQFANPRVLERALRERQVDIMLEQRTKAESDPAVAAASILARERFVDWLDRTSAACGVKLPPGASATVQQAAAELIAKHGPEALGKAAKLHFRTTGQILGTRRADAADEPS
ncbi:MAG: ribonuclease HIII [Verrucomicrobia bacterium]|nr:ribonuclease HIII [Verrucomicrobiota bacterium]